MVSSFQSPGQATVGIEMQILGSPLGLFWLGLGFFVCLVFFVVFFVLLLLLFCFKVNQVLSLVLLKGEGQ